MDNERRSSECGTSEPETTEKIIKDWIVSCKELRKDLDATLQKMKCDFYSPERENAKKKLQESIMWLGMELKAISEAHPRINNPNPYPDSYDPSNTKIAPTADGLKL